MRGTPIAFSITRILIFWGLYLKELYWEPQTGNPKNIVGIYLPRVLVFHYVPAIFLGFPVWGYQ